MRSRKKWGSWQCGTVTSRASEIKNRNSTLRTTKIKVSATPVDREKDSLELGAIYFFNFPELQTILSFYFDDNLSQDMIKSRHESLPYGVKYRKIFLCLLLILSGVPF